MGRAHAPVDACDAGISIRSGANPLTQPAWAQLMVAFLQLWQCHVACSCHICRMHAPARVQMVLQACIISTCAPNPEVNPTSCRPSAYISATISATAANLVTRLQILQATSCEVALCSWPWHGLHGPLCKMLQSICDRQHASSMQAVLAYDNELRV